MKATERFRRYLSGQSVDRMPALEWAPWWDLTLDRWYTEGLPASCRDVDSIQGFFGLDRCLQTGAWVRTDKTPQPPGWGLGIMENERDYETRVRPTLFPDPRGILTEDHLRWLRATRDRGDTLHFFTVEGAFWYPRTLFGIENHLFSFYDEPELYGRLCDDYAEWLLQLFPVVFEAFPFDFMSFAEDMSYNNGPMISKDLFDAFLAPFYAKVIPAIHAYGIPVFVDSDGDITKAVDWYAEVGADGMFPLERQAGVDVSTYLEKQPNMAFLGHFDKMCMKNGEAAMRAEFERILPSLQGGKVIASVDHQTPPDVSMENYRTYVRLLQEVAAKITHEGVAIAPCPVFR